MLLFGFTNDSKLRIPVVYVGVVFERVVVADNAWTKMRVGFKTKLFRSARKTVCAYVVGRL